MTTYKGTMAVRQATLARYTDGSPIIKIQFPFDPNDVDTVKSIPGRKWHPTYKVWTCPPSTIAIKTLQSVDFVISKKLLQYIRERDSENTIKKIPGLKKKLFPYQLKGVNFLQSRNGRALLGDSMGLGKTIQAIAWLMLNPGIRPAIIIVPASVKLNWMKEIMAWTDTTKKDIEVLQGKKPYPVSGKFIIVNYDILSDWVKVLRGLNPQVLICDESQYLKNHKAKRTHAVRALAKGVPHFIAMSGTPITNRPIEFFTTLQLIDPDLFPNWFTYTGRYCDRKHDGFGWNVNGASNIEELHETLVSTCMLRRTKEEVLPDLPDKITSFFPLEMHPDLEQEYLEAENNFMEWMKTRRGAAAAERASNAQALAEIEVLKQVAVAAKLPHAVDWIKDFLDTGEKLVVFATHKFVIEALMKQFSKVAVKLDGSVTGTKRQVAVDKFQNEAETRLFVGNIKAAGVGITLTAASNVAFLELPWTPGDLQQAGDRLHRIGQKNTVNVYYLLAEYTIEEKIAALLDKKRKVIDGVLDGKETEDSSLLMELIENY